MSATMMSVEHDMAEWLRRDYGDELSRLGQGYPKDERSLVLDHAAIYQREPDWGDDWIDYPDSMRQKFREALSYVDLPVDVDISGAHIRIKNVGDAQTFYPGTYSPADRVGELLCIQGEVAKATDLEPIIESGAFECQRCGTLTRTGGARRPHECSGCERKGPFKLSDEQTDFTDRQKARIKTPPDVQEASGSFVDALLFDDIAGAVSVGDHVKATGVLRFEETEDADGSVQLEPYLDVSWAEPLDDTDTDLTVSDDDKDAIQAAIDDAEHDPLDVAANSLHHGIYGHHEAKKGLILAAIGGDRAGGDRGDIHVLLLGDPSTGKSELGDKVAELVPRGVDAQAAFSTGVGLTASCVRNDDFGDGGWTIEAGAFVKANGGLLWLDELDDLASEDLKALNNPMETQRITVRKADVEAEFATEATVIAAANPDETTFDPYGELAPQFGFQDDILARFDLIYPFQDSQDERHDSNVAKQALAHNYAKKTGGDVETVAPKPNISQELLQKWIFLASEHGPVTWADESVLDEAVEAYTDLRKHYASNADTGKQVTARNIGAIRRLCEAVAKFHFADAITSEHVDIAVRRLKASLADLDRAEHDEPATVETQQDRVWTIKEIIQDLSNGQGAPLEAVYDKAEEVGISRQKAEHQIQKLKDGGQLYNPGTSEVSVV